MQCVKDDYASFCAVKSPESCLDMFCWLFNGSIHLRGMCFQLGVIIMNFCLITVEISA